MRYTRKFIEARFAAAMDAIGAAHGDAWVKAPNGAYTANVGTHQIDYNPVYGGYVITKIVSDGGGEACPFGMDRRNAAGFVAMLNGILGAAQYMRKREV